MVADEQTHTLPAEREGLERFARFLAFRTATPSPRCCSRICATCSGTMRPLFENAPAVEAGNRRPLLFPPEADDRETLDRLAEMGFRNPLEASGTGARAGPAGTTVR